MEEELVAGLTKSEMDDEAGKKKSAADSNECVSVVVRCRPMNTKEKNENRSSIIDIDVAARQVSIKNPADQDFKSFTYDGAYDETTQQRVFYEESCFGIIESVLEGFNGTIFAYGQTGMLCKCFENHCEEIIPSFDILP